LREKEREGERGDRDREREQKRKKNGKVEIYTKFCIDTICTQGYHIAKMIG
jgi:hypothetical protein